jgi:hypothetical protein
MRQILIVFMFVRKKILHYGYLYQFGVGLGAFTGFNSSSEFTVFDGFPGGQYWI